MGKRKIGEIYNRPIIEGDINLKTSSEIHKSELNVPQSGGGDAPSGGEGGSRSEMRYYLTSELEALGMAMIYTMMCVNLYRYRDGDSGIIGTSSFFRTHEARFA